MKQKNDPEKELVNRKMIDNVIFWIIAIFSLAFAVWFVLAMIDDVLPIYIKHPQLISLAIVFGLSCLGMLLLGGFLKYGLWNDHRIEQLQKIIESEDTDDD